MPKLLIINVTCNQGSTGSIAEQAGLLMKFRGWEVYYAHGARRVKSSQLNTIPFSSLHEEYIHALKSLLFDADGLGSVSATKKLLQAIDSIRPDVVHIHNIHGYYLNYKILFEYLNRTNIPIVMTLHDCWSFTGHCFHFIVKGCDKWKKECYNCPLQKEYPTKSLLLDRSRKNFKLKKEILGANNNLHIVTVSEWLKQTVEESFYKGKDIRVISNGVDLNTFKPIKMAPKDTFDILAVSNMWYKDKGIFDFFSLSRFLKDNERIILVGGNINNFKKLAPPNIIFIEHTNSQEELVSLYNNADVIASLSYAETFGLTIAEGTACGTPAIVYDNTALPASVSDKTGLVVKTGDVAAVYRAIQKIKEKGKSSFIKDCRQYAVKHFDKNKCYKEYVELYESLVV